ncbi:hypothetical protein TL16_g10831 [Triparma laevis f. inornata]|uniref:Uncharacterized protein n=1 Tax=Triparma laevis f. inornata TaxID=1714386 RepID=A0A9W7BBG7_9STRA|nr:hypothetical protein TL16_g10831 [Triparma laevis f. inornata]
MRAPPSPVSLHCMSGELSVLLALPQPPPSPPPAPSSGSMYDILLDTYDPPCPESGRTKGIVKSLRVRAKTLAKCVSELTDELSTEQLHVQSLQSNVEKLTSDRSCLQTSLHSSNEKTTTLENEKTELTQESTNSKVQFAEELSEVHKTYSTQLSTLNEENVSLKSELKIAQHKCIEVESFLSSTPGRNYNKLEGVLAETKLRLALAQAERDELELKCDSCSMCSESENDWGNERHFMGGKDCVQPIGYKKNKNSRGRAILGELNEENER